MGQHFFFERYESCYKRNASQCENIKETNYAFNFFLNKQNAFNLGQHIANFKSKSDGLENAIYHMNIVFLDKFEYKSE